MEVNPKSITKQYTPHPLSHLRINQLSN